MNKPNLIALFAVIVGIVAAILLPVGPGAWIVGSGLFITLILGSHSRFRPCATGWLIIGCLLCLAGLICSYQRENYREQLRYNDYFTGKRLVLEGKMASRPEKTDWGVRFDLVLKKYRNHPRGKVTIYYTGKVAEAWLGRVVRVPGRFGKVRGNNAQGFPDFYEKRQLTGSLIANQAPVLVSETAPGLACDFWANQLRLRMARVAQENLSSVNRQVLQGMLFGDELAETGPEGEVLENFRRTGTIHLLSVSGLHVGFVVAGLTALLGWCGIRPAARLPLIILGVGFYIMMTGLEAPVLRSGCMLLIYLIANRLKTNDDPLNRLSLAAVILLLVRPANLFEIGFQLSFTATAGVVGLYPVLQRYFPVKQPFLKPVWHTLIISVSAQLMVIPLLAWYFYQISWIAPLANLLLAVPSFLIMLGGLAGELLGLFVPAVAHIVLEGVGRLIDLCLQLMRICSTPVWAVSWTPRWPWPWLVAYYLGLALVLQKLRPNLITGKRDINPVRMGLLVLLTLTVTVWTGVYLKSQRGYLEAVFIDVGQGDAIFLKTPDNYRVLVDGGDEGRGRNRVLPYLQQHGVSRLDAVFGTHGHQDHLGGLDEVLLKLPAG
ncbi:MAG TPA: ComEC/Rec2 family competence protein, partial [Bacillota bacterium]|nr:ComEC/Rec2 family competence protein [Bacillota bacterium]